MSNVGKELTNLRLLIGDLADYAATDELLIHCDSFRAPSY